MESRTVKTNLTFPTAEEAAAADSAVLAHLRATSHSQANGWSGVYTNGAAFGILWAPVVAAALNLSEEPLNLVIADDWVPYQPTS